MDRTLVALALVLTLGPAPWPASAQRPSPETLAMAPDLEASVRAARAAAARHTGLAPETLVLLGAERVTWSDGSLGCPQPGMMYTQALVPGFRVRLRGPDGELAVHLDARGHAVLCPSQHARPPLPGDARPTS